MSLSPKPVAYYPLGDQDAFNGADYLVPNSSLKDYVFDFDSDYIEVPNSTDFDFGTGDFTISSWVNTTGTPTQHGTVVSKQNPAISGQWTFQVLRDGRVSFYGNNGGIDVLSTTTIIDGNWHNIVIQRTGNIFNLYIDKVLADQLTASGQNITNTQVLRIGRRLATYNGYFDGQISNVQIFNSALPATGSNSVETLYNNGSPLTSMSGFSSLVSWWKLDDSATFDSSTNTWTIPDDSTNSNTGTSFGMTQANLVQSDLSFTSGYSPYALDFDAASSDYIDCGNVPELNGVTQMSFSIWFNNQTPSNNKGLIGDMQAVNFSPALGRFHLIVRNVSSNDYSFRLYIIGSDSLEHSINIDNRPFTAGQWYNLVMTYNAGTVNFYVDGSLAPSTIQAGAPIPTSFGTLTYPPNRPLQIGRWSNLYFDGKISNASIWNTALTSAQVSEIYSEGIPQNLLNHSAVSSLVSWWQLGSNTSWVDPYWIALDEKGTNNGQSQNIAAPNNMGEDAIVDGVGSYANGLSSGMGGDEVIGDAPYSTANALSVNMDVEDRDTDTPS
jgi:hypothetical protein